MCTVSIKVNDNLLHRAWANMDKDVDMAEWMQQQIEAILIKMALATETKKRQDTVALDLAESKTDRQPIPDVVLSLLGAGRSVDDEALQRLMDFAAADPKTITLNDLAGILPAPQTSIEELRDEYIREKYGV